MGCVGCWSRVELRGLRQIVASPASTPSSVPFHLSGECRRASAVGLTIGGRASAQERQERDQHRMQRR